MDKLYFELAYVPGDEVKTEPFMRLCLALEKRFPYIREWQQIQDLCDIAAEDTIQRCFFTFRDTWLKTTVTFKNLDRLFSGPLSKDEIRGRIRGSNGPGVDDHSRTSVEQRDSKRLPCPRALTTAEVADDVEPQIDIRRNVLPLKMYRRPHLTRNFYKRWILDKSHREGKSLQEVRREYYSKYAFATSLRPVALLRHNKLVPAETPSMTTSPEAAPGKVDLQTVDHTQIILIKEFASGSEGSVWKVVWGTCTYALKSYMLGFEEFFKTDCKIVTMRPVSQHPHIVQVFGQSRCFLEDEKKQNHCLLMELLDGDLRRVLHEATRSKKPLSPFHKLDVLSQIACAMIELHENEVVHGDLKPGNILLGDFEVSGHVRHFLAKVADFGSAKINPGSNFIPSAGTTPYASPEVLMMRSAVKNLPNRVMLDVSAKLDVYSFGAVAYEILTECKPFGGELKGQNLIDVATGKTRLIDSEEWKSVNRFGYHFGYYNDVVPLVEKCLKWDPKERPTFFEVCETLRCARSNLHALERRVLELLRIILVLGMYILIFAPCS